jgi:hypothetical protein
MPLSSSVTTQAAGIANCATGYAATSSASATATSFVVGFKPRVVRFHNVTDRISDEWIQGMAAASSIHSVAAGTRTLETTNGITVGEVTDTYTGAVGWGFTVTAVTAVASKVFAWEAIG